jgi:hypothetical protein
MIRAVDLRERCYLSLAETGLLPQMSWNICKLQLGIAVHANGNGLIARRHEPDTSGWKLVADVFFAFLRRPAAIHFK